MSELLAEHYLALKHTHMLTAIVSLLLFSFRSVLDLAKVAWRQWRWLRVLPHLNDTLLLSLAILLCIVIGQSPFDTLWLGVKVAAVIGYILCGFYTLKWARTRGQKLAGFGGALLLYSYAAHTALSKTTWLG